MYKDSSQRLTIYYEVDLVDLLQRGRAEQMLYFTLFFRQSAFLPDVEGRLFLDDALAASNAYAVAVEEDLQENVEAAIAHMVKLKPPAAKGTYVKRVSVCASRTPSVVSKPVFAPVRVRTALVVTVVPCTMVSMDCASDLSEIAMLVESD